MEQPRDQDAQVETLGTDAAKDPERIAEAPLADWEDEWVDLGGEG
jgi:hypothetical protein